MIHSFSNRRRAKDTIMLVLDKYGEDKITVFIQEDMVFIDDGDVIPSDDIDILMHYATKVDESTIDMSLDNITELYRGNGLAKFRA